MISGLSNTLKHDAIALAIASGDVVKVAFYGPGTSLTSASPVYTSSQEITDPGATPALNAGGFTLSGRTLTASDGSAATASVGWNTFYFTPSKEWVVSLMLVYNWTRSNRALAVRSFATPQVYEAGTRYDALSLAALLRLG